MRRTTKTTTKAALTALAAAATIPMATKAQTHDAIEVPLRVEAGRLVVDVTTPDGATLPFLLSTGNPATILAASTAAHLGDAPRLSLGAANVVTEGLFELPDAQLVVEGTQYAGIVAGNTLNQYDVLLDAPHGRLVLKPFAPRVTWPGVALGDPIPLRIFHGLVLSLDVTLDGQAMGAMLDIGAAPLLVNAGAAAKLGIDGEGAVALGIGGATLPNQAVAVSDLDALRRFDPDNAGFAIVGAPLAYDCAMSISWVHSEIRMCAR